MNPKLGTDGDSKLIPLSGETQERMNTPTDIPPAARRLFSSPSFRVEAYAAILAVVAAGLAYGLYEAGYSLGSAWAVLGLALLSAIAERGRVRLNSNTELSISLLPTLFAAVAFGPLAAMVVGAASLIGDFRTPYLKWAVFTASESIT